MVKNAEKICENCKFCFLDLEYNEYWPNVYCRWLPSFDLGMRVDELHTCPQFKKKTKADMKFWDEKKKDIEERQCLIREERNRQKKAIQKTKDDCLAGKIDIQTTESQLMRELHDPYNYEINSIVEELLEKRPVQPKEKIPKKQFRFLDIFKK